MLVSHLEEGLLRGPYNGSVHAFGSCSSGLAVRNRNVIITLQKKECLF